MTDFLLGYNNYFDAATLSGGDWQIALSNIQDPRPSRKARSTSASTTQTILRADLGSAKDIRMLAVTHTNLTSAALYRVTWFSDEYVTAIDTTDWLAVKGYPETDPDMIGASIFHIFAAVNSARYWQVEINDDANPAGYIEIGRAFFPDAFVPENRFGTQNSEDVDVNTVKTEALGGAPYFNRRTPKRKFKATLERVLSAEIETLRKIRKIANINKQVVLVPSIADEDNYNDRCFVATFDQLPGITLLEGDDNSASVSIELTEVVG